MVVHVAPCDRNTAFRDFVDRSLAVFRKKERRKNRANRPIVRTVYVIRGEYVGLAPSTGRELTNKFRLLSVPPLRAHPPTRARVLITYVPPAYSNAPAFPVTKTPSVRPQTPRHALSRRRSVADNYDIVSQLYRLARYLALVG